MMGFSVIFIFALLQICTLCDGGNSEDLSNISDSSNHPHHRHPRGLFDKLRSAMKKKDGSAKKEEDQSIVYFQHLELVASEYPPEGAAQVSFNKEDYYILIGGNCNDFRVLKSSETSPRGFQFLVNKDNFDILEWKKAADIIRLSIHYIEFCDKYVIVKDNNGISLMTVDSLTESSKVLTVNYDIKGQDFQTDNCGEEKKVKPDKIEVIKQVTAENNNCKPAKHVVKFDQGNDISKSILKSRTHTVGGAMEFSASGKILELVQLGGKASGKYDYTRLNSETTSKVDKDLHSVSMEIEVPPNHSCTIEIKSRISTVEALCSGLLTRQYKNGEERTTSVTGIYNQEKVTELLTSMNLCTTVKGGAKC